MKHVLKEKVSYCQVPPDYVGNLLTHRRENYFESYTTDKNLLISKVSKYEKVKSDARCI